MSVACYGINTLTETEDELRELFSSVSFTETPLNEIHSMLEIKNHSVKLEQYGLVFLKERLESKGVSPVLYLNNILGDKDPVVRALCNLKNTNPKEAKELLPLLSIFGKKLTPFPARPMNHCEIGKEVDFFWEREWRYPYAKGPLEFNRGDIFVGLCPHDKIEHFEDLAQDNGLPELKFVDPLRNMKFYASELIDARKVLKRHKIEIKSSVV